MANLANPRKQFQFSIYIVTPFGVAVNPFLVQKLTLPDQENDSVEHGDANYLVKTAGLMKVGKLIAEKISTASAPDNSMWDWLQSIQDAHLGGGTIPDQYKKIIEVTQFATDGITPINQWRYEGAWPQKIHGVELSRTSSDNTIERIEFDVDIPLRV